jgi:hypothetical protein
MRNKRFCADCFDKYQDRILIKGSVSHGYCEECGKESKTWDCVLVPEKKEGENVGQRKSI